MPPPRHVDRTTRPERGADRGGTWGLFVVGDGRMFFHPLPDHGEVVLGRGTDCELRLDHDEVSRRHAIVRAGTRVTVQDLDSRNGIRAGRGKVVGGPAIPLAAGESFQLGPFALMLTRSGDGELSASSASGASAEIVLDAPTLDAATPMLGRIARAGVNVLIRGETGVGKEVLAATLHALSGRAGPMLAINCAAISESLVESELFGYERGAFTGAVQAKPGLFEAAAGGTVLLDEIGELSPALQAKLLRAIEAREVIRLGGVKPIALDVRVLAATHRDLREGIRRDIFRQDLYFRLNGITLLIRPLRERVGRIAALALELLPGIAARAGVPTPRLHPDAIARMQRHPWPGNVRELRVVLERAVVLCDGQEIRARHVRMDPPAATECAPAVETPPATRGATAQDPDDDERARVIAALEAAAGNQTRAARALGISRGTLVNRIVRLRIPRPRG